MLEGQSQASGEDLEKGRTEGAPETTEARQIVAE